MTGAVDTAKDVYKATKEVRNAIDTYNRACKDFDRWQTSDNPTRYCRYKISAHKAMHRI